MLTLAKRWDDYNQMAKDSGERSREQMVRENIIIHYIVVLVLDLCFPYRDWTTKTLKIKTDRKNLDRNPPKYGRKTQQHQLA